MGEEPPGAVRGASCIHPGAAVAARRQTRPPAGRYAAHRGIPGDTAESPGRESNGSKEVIMAEENFNIDDEKFEELIAGAVESINEKYELTKPLFMSDKDFAQKQLKIAETQSRIDEEIMRRVYERHRDDGNLFPLIFGYASGTVAGINLLTLLPLEGPTQVVTKVVQIAMPTYASLFDKLIKGEIDKELNEM